MEITQLPEQPHKPEKSQKNAVDTLLKKLGKTSGPKGADVIYGLYDAAHQPMMTRLNDFLIDHSKVPLQEKAYFFQLMAVMVDAGIPVIQAVKMPWQLASL